MGAILAGGQSRRFGSDKAHATFSDKRLIDCVSDAMQAQCEGVIVCGREEPGFTCIPDLPDLGLGPLGGLNAALSYACSSGFSHVLSAGVDVPNLRHDLAATLAGDGAAIVKSQPVVGLWPAKSAPDLAAFMKGGGRALYGFAERIGARRVDCVPALMNVNTIKDLDS